MNGEKYTVRQWFDLRYNSLLAYYNKEESKHFLYILLEECLGIKRSHLYLEHDSLMRTDDIERIDTMVEQLKHYKPVQYIVGKQSFFNIDFEVNTDVLIPRPETEELIYHLKSSGRIFNNILDIGTGSGVLAISLKKLFPKAKVRAIDISTDALQTAKRNAAKHKLEIEFLLADILKTESLLGFSYTSYDLIVSNPPYVRESEKRLMKKNVLNYEPHLALFVSDDDPLIFYNAILKYAEKALKQNGLLLVEINEAFGEETKNLFMQKFSNVNIIQDINNKDRFVQASA